MYVRERSADSIWETAPAFFVMKSPYMLRYGRKASSLDTLPMGCGRGGCSSRRCVDVIGGERSRGIAWVFRSWTD